MERSTGKNRNIIFLHGLCGSQDNFYYLKQDFPGSKSFDLIGFGREKKPDAQYDKACFLEFMEKFINTPSILIGHSMGAILAKEFALKHPHLVQRIYAIGYPVQKSPEQMEVTVRNDKFMSMYIDENIAAKMICQAKCLYKYLLIPLGLLFYYNYYLSFWHYFSHTYISASNSIKNTILRDEYHSTLLIKDKMIFIVGEKDCYTDKSLLKELTHFEIEGMNHNFFGFEKKIADIIMSDLG